MIKLENIHPLADFKRNAKAFVDRIKATKAPIVLTVNGKAEVVIQDAVAFQDMQNHIQCLKEELRAIKLQALKQDLAFGAQQLQQGDYIEYDDASTASLESKIKERGRQRLAQNPPL
ncbi:type II toxin-antitoxin system Phd/YefM family antitoxin [Nodosilinea sp. LEGE 07088]|uniref:type II toxin-antitoxin system Phd/YefM family antitoxin n=1 Tax=Nodosilinea sp. LEGE 07088 TaxID=2777968 RepID=UPI001881A151|nr:type II toxin-antitoxin system Phd/YefM family antitoxin [Nodosilinea sp. LEGE 07088]MBE9141468.1 type II toxin-antitoxin system Phd/YefM family antitoxin [Nodosilinea sp. LEGE 07088]